MKTKYCLSAILAGQLCLAGLSPAAPNYVAHEWGTFTSVQGADGVQFAWNPLSVSDLPAFVHDWPKSGPASQRDARHALVGKAVSMTLQRMETPVIYFYSDEEMTLNASVNFPLGTMTEWYPQATLPAGPKDAGILGPKGLRWENVRISPTDTKSAGALPADKGASHYYAARETDADVLRVNGETEKFLFYRGVGNFRAPLTVTQTGRHGEAVALENSGSEALRHLFIYQVGNAGGRFVHVADLAPGGRHEVTLGASVPFSALSDAREKLAGEMARALTREGLYEREARAMVKTWDDSWFGEKGIRVLYILPGQWTDRVLPLTLLPKPAEIARVMVGRAELITPQMEADLLREIVRYGKGTPEERAQAVASARALGLGRFMEPTVRRLTSRNRGRDFAAHSAALLNAVAGAKPPPQPEKKGLASK